MEELQNRKPPAGQHEVRYAFFPVLRNTKIMCIILTLVSSYLVLSRKLKHIQGLGLTNRVQSVDSGSPTEGYVVDCVGVRLLSPLEKQVELHVGDGWSRNIPPSHEGGGVDKCLFYFPSCSCKIALDFPSPFLLRHSS